MDNNGILDAHASDDIVFRLENFEGSIHLLVHLCRSNGYDIRTVKIALLVDQYIEYINGIENAGLDMEVTTEFLVTAATLLEIKARSAIPVEQEAMEDEEDIFDPEEELRRGMLEYEMFAEKAQKIKKTETINRFYREPTFTDADARISITGFDLDKLMQAYAKVLYRFSHIVETENQVKTIEKDEFTVAQKIESLISELVEKKQVNFFELFSEDYTKNEVINTFLALLQLIGKQFAVVRQEEKFGDIQISISDECDPETYDYSVLAMSEEDN